MKRKQKQDPIGLENNQPGVDQGDEELFEALKRVKKKKRRKRIRIIIILVILLAVGIYAGMKILQKQVREQFASSTEEVLSAQAERGSLTTVISGSGMLVNVDTETVSVPAGVTVTEILVKYGDTVTAGDMLATVDMATVRSAMSDLQTQIDDLDDDIADAKGDSVNRYVSAGVSGRVKIIYASEGDKIEDVMVEHGSIAVVSIDGYMAVDITADGVNKGDSVVVTRPDGSTVNGTVESVVGKNVTVIMTDNGPEYDEEVTVSTSEGKDIGFGKLYIHNPLAVTGYAGTVSRINVNLNQSVYSTSTIVTLTDTSTTASYNALLRQRSEMEKTLLELLKIQRDGSIVSPISGGIYSVSELDEDNETTSEATEIVTISPDINVEVTISVDESDILSLEVGQKASITVRSIGDETIEGQVTEIDKTYSNSKYTATITLPKVEGMIAGMTASVKVQIEGVDDAILIPVDALHQTSNGYYVYTSYDEETGEYGSRVDVIPGLSNSDNVEIKSGLNEGDTVYYVKAQTFTDIFSAMASGGGMPSGFGGGSSSSGGMPSGFGGGSSGGGMPSGFGGGSSSGGGMPSGFSGGSSSGGRPNGFGG